VEGALRGAPALFDCAYFDALCAVTGDIGGRHLLQQHGDAVVAIPAPAGWLRDIDRPEDLL
jgi:CTP:molybdopterin cytidylyltransferase MocA